MLACLFLRTIGILLNQMIQTLITCKKSCPFGKKKLDERLEAISQNNDRIKTIEDLFFELDQ